MMPVRAALAAAAGGAFLGLSLFLSPLLAAAQTLVVYGDERLPPYEFLEDGQPKGINVDLWRAIAQTLGRPLEIRLTDWPRAQEEVLAGHGHALSSLGRTPEREVSYGFTQTIYHFNFSLFVRNQDAPAFELHPLAARRIGVTPAGLPRKYFEKNHPQVPLVIVPDTIEGIRRLLRGDIDAFAGNTWTGEYFLRELGIGGISPLPRPFTSLEGAIAVPRDDAATLADIDEAISRIRADGTFDRILDQWAGQRIHVISQQQLANLAWIAVALVCAATVAALMFRYRRRQRDWVRTRTALQESEALFKKLTDALPGFVFVADGEGMNTFVNAAFQKYTGLCESELLRDGWLEVLHPDDAGHMARRWGEAVASGGAYAAECRFRCHDGSYRWHLCRGLPIRDAESGSIVRWTGVALDVDEVKRTEAALRASEAKYRTLFSNMGEGFALCEMQYDERGAPVGLVWIEANPAFFEQSGLPREIIGRRSDEVLPALEPCWLEAYDSVIRTGKTVRFENYSGITGRYYQVCGYAVGGKRFGVVFRDVTEVRLAARQLQESEARFRSIFEQAAVGLAYVSLQGVPIQTNEKFCAILGYGKEELAGLNLKDLSHPDEQAADLENVGLLMSGAIASCAWEKRYFRKDGSVVWTNLTLSLARQAEGGPGCFIAVLEDIQQRKDAERALAEERQARHAILEQQVSERTAELSTANQELERFAFATSHDLRGPLGRINSFSELLEKRCRPQLGSEGLNYLDFIRQNALRLTCLVDDLMSHAVVAQNALQLEKADILSLTREVLIAKSEALKAAGAEILVDLAGAEVICDHYGFAQALGNLIENAIKYSVKLGAPVIRIGGAREGEYYRLWVRDNGIGFDMAYHDKIFEMFRRLHTYNEYPGTGIGLALVKRAMERMGGRVWAESEPGRGSTFHLALPLADDREIHEARSTEIA